ncbi:MAG: hypothetical protein HC910_10845 [Spirulinaceae cyanobacterium SM2_1_0]|nr:hypothetical protein [Spirulinaceae cyanobacterium SM2_1_0]
MLAAHKGTRFSPDDQQLASVSRDVTLMIWERESGKRRHCFADPASQR